MKHILFYFLNLNLLIAINSCIVSENSREIQRQEYIIHEKIESENFVIHYTTAIDDFQEINGQLYSLQSSHTYAQSIIDLAEQSLNYYYSNGWESLPPDCDESISDLNSPDHCINYGGNSLYDIYISNDGVGMVVPENLYSESPYTGGRTSYMKITTLSNNYETLPIWSHHVIAHEVHHSIQLRYGTGTSGVPGNYIHNLWFFEQTATYMQNAVFPYTNHLFTMLSNCDVVTPLTNTNLGIDYPADIYPYRGALWQKYLVKSTGDSSIVRTLWEEYGQRFSNQESVSLLPIYENSLNLSTDNQTSLTEAFSDYALWRYFTGSRAVNNNFFEDAEGYCTSSTYDFDQNYSLILNRGGSYFFEIPNETLNITLFSEDYDRLVCSHIKYGNDGVVSDQLIGLNDEESYLNFNYQSEVSQALLISTDYLDTENREIYFSINLNQMSNGDLNFDNQINVIDIIYIINLILENEYQAYADLNADSLLDILDAILLVEIILNI